MLRFANEPLRVPLDGGEEGKCWVLEAFDDAIGGFGDDAQAAAEAVGGLFVIAIDGNFGLADGTADLGRGVERGVVAGKVVADFAVFDRFGAGDVGEKLVHAAAAVDIHELGTEANAEGGKAAFFDFGQKGQFEFLASGIDALGFGMPGLAVEGGVEIVSAGEENSVEQIDVLRDEGEVGFIGDEQRESSGAFDGFAVIAGRFVFAGVVVSINRDADFGAIHNSTAVYISTTAACFRFERLRSFSVSKSFRRRMLLGVTSTSSSSSMYSSACSRVIFARV